MAKYKKILVAYDGSESAKNALAVSVELAKQDNSWIKVLDVVTPYNGEATLTDGSNINGIKITRIEIIAIIKLAVIRPSPYKISIKKLFLGSLVTPKL